MASITIYRRLENISGEPRDISNSVTWIIQPHISDVALTLQPI